MSITNIPTKKTATRKINWLASERPIAFEVGIRIKNCRSVKTLNAISATYKTINTFFSSAGSLKTINNGIATI